MTGDDAIRIAKVRRHPSIPSRPRSRAPDSGYRPDADIRNQFGLC